MFVIVPMVLLQWTKYVLMTAITFVCLVLVGFIRMGISVRSAPRVDRVSTEQGLIVMVVETMILKRATRALIVTRANTKRVPRVAMELEGVLLLQLVRGNHFSQKQRHSLQQKQPV